MVLVLPYYVKIKGNKYIEVKSQKFEGALKLKAAIFTGRGAKINPIYTEVFSRLRYFRKNIQIIVFYKTMRLDGARWLGDGKLFMTSTYVDISGPKESWLHTQNSVYNFELNSRGVMG